MDDAAFLAWQETVPAQIRSDMLWRSQGYRLALYAGDLATDDADTCRSADAPELSDQLRRAVLSISANFAEGFGRSGGPDRARFFEYALGSAREGRDWYYKARKILGPQRTNQALDVLTSLSRLLIVVVRREHSDSSIRRRAV